MIESENMDDQEKHRILQQYYFNAENPAAFSGSSKLFRVLEKRYPGAFTLDYIKQ